MSCLETLKGKGLRLTPQRRLIVDIIHESHDHLTAEHIIESVQEKMPGVNKSTIYRTLDTLEQAGCVYRSEPGDHAIYHHAEEGHHHHLVCSCCGKTVECSEDVFNSLQKSLSQRYGFQVDFKHMLIHGLCKSCLKNKI